MIGDNGLWTVDDGQWTMDRLREGKVYGTGLQEDCCVAAGA